MGKIIQTNSGVISNQALERFEYWSPHKETEVFNGRRFTVVNTLPLEDKSAAPFKYLIRFSDGSLVEADLFELVGAYRNGLQKYRSHDAIPAELEVPAFVYPQWNSKKWVAERIDDEFGSLVTLKCGDTLVASQHFPMEYKVCYVASPLSAPLPTTMVRNINSARNHEIHAAQYAKCNRAFAPHAWLPYVVDDTDENQREAALQFGLHCLSLCRCLVVFAADGISAGMRGEIQKALELGLDIFYAGLACPNELCWDTRNWEFESGTITIPTSTNEIARDLLGFDCLINSDSTKIKLELRLVVSPATGSVSLSGSFESLLSGRVGSIRLRPTNMNEFAQIVRERWLSTIGSSTEHQKLRGTSVFPSVTKKLATQQLQLEALVYRCAKDGECWRPGGCFHNSNGDSYIRCNRTLGGICDCFHAERDDTLPGFSFMNDAFQKTGLCDYEMMRKLTQGSEG